MNAFFGFALTSCASKESGFDMVFIVFAAHSHVKKINEKCEKMWSKFEVRSGTLRGTLLGSILERFGVTLGSLGASLWEKMGFGKASKKWSEKQECGEFRYTLEMTPFVPIKNHFSSLVDM